MLRTESITKMLDFSQQSKTLIKKSFGRLITLAQVFSDIATVLICYMGSYFIYSNTLSRPSPQKPLEFLLISVLVSLVYVILLEREGLYRREISLLNTKELRGIFHVGIFSAAIVLSASFYIRSMSFSRITLTAAILTAPVLLYLQRQFFYKLHILFHQKGLSQRRVFIFGAGNIGQHLAKRLFESPSLGYLPVGFFDDDGSKKSSQIKWNGVGPKGGLPVLGTDDDLEKFIQKMDVEFIVIALPSASFERNQRLVAKCKELNISYAIVPNAYEQFIQGIEVFEIGGIPLLRRKEERNLFVYRFLKRVLDIFLALFFIIILSPLVLVISVLIKSDSKGPVIFKQKRIGYKGKEFSIYKFRSMHTHAPLYARTPENPSDPRITRVGRWLRRTSLDELPQIFNVLRGDMSLVGPRPEMPFIVESYTPLQKERLKAKPGITGIWQISAVRGEPIHSNIEYDLFYIENRSLLLDIAIILKTILSVIRGIGAV